MSQRAASSPDPGDVDICERAALRAAAEYDVPTDLLLAVAEVESGLTPGQNVTAWPWTLNTAGLSQRFPTRAAAIAHLRGLVSSGERNIDIGCFQINHRWHRHQFQSVTDMLDPWGNARYAARFLASLREDLGSWAAATGAYHSRQPELAQAYRMRVARALGRLAPPTPDNPTVAAPTSSDTTRTNRYPFLRTRDDGIRAAGSLVPIADGAPANASMF